MIDAVSTMQHINWRQATDLNVYEFLNTFCYYQEKIRYENKLRQEAMEKAKARKRY